MKLFKLLCRAIGYIIGKIYLRRELLTILISALVVWKLPFFLRDHVDSTAQVPDVGTMGSLAMAICMVLIVKSLTWFLMNMLWPDLATYFKTTFAHDFNSLQPCARVLIALGFYCFLLASPLLVLVALR